MKIKTFISVLTITFLSTATSVMAETAVREDHSLFLTWVFLGICGLIIVLQILKGMQN
ncbi:MAG: hypothetical protein J7L57_01550 [Deltaproteobacteria bacterium]|nr:hypothetical protein [Candidatus Tharpella sp.]